MIHLIRFSISWALLTITLAIFSAPAILFYAATFVSIGFTILVHEAEASRDHYNRTREFLQSCNSEEQGWFSKAE